MKRGLIIVLVLSMLVGVMSVSSFAAVRNYQNGGMMNGNYSNNGGMNNSNYSGGMMSGNFAGRGNMMNGNVSGQGGMMNSMMNGNFGGMMGWNTDGTNEGVLSENAITLEAAYAVGKSYLEKELSSEYTLDKEGIATGDFYTFFIESNDKTVGRLSVNALTSEVWLHNCRGLLQ